MRAILTTLLLLALIGSIAFNFLLLIAVAFRGDKSSNTVTIMDGNRTQKIAVIPLAGAIMGETTAQFTRFLDAAKDDPNVKALVIEIDSPGGTVTDSDEIHHRILAFKEARGIPVVVTMRSMATSGGYYVACAADYIYAQPTTITGNIGVLLPRFNIHKLMDEWGIEETTIESTGADFKNAGSMFRPERLEDTAYLQAIADSAFAQFKAVVERGRGRRLTQPLDSIANGKMYLADQARALGLIDDIGYAENAYDHAASQALLTDPMIVRYQDPPTLIQTLLSGRAQGGVAVKGLSMEGVHVKIDSKILHELAAPRVLYMGRGH